MYIGFYIKILLKSKTRLYILLTKQKGYIWFFGVWIDKHDQRISNKFSYFLLWYIVHVTKMH